MVVEERDIWGGDWHSLGISRSALHYALRDAAGHSPAQFGMTVTGLRTTPEGVEVTRSDGHEQVYSAVLGADGHRSDDPRVRERGVLLRKSPRGSHWAER